MVVQSLTFSFYAMGNEKVHWTCSLVQELRQKCKRGGVDKLFFMNEGQVVGIRLSLGESLGEVRLSGSSPASLTFFFEPVSSS